MSPLKNPRTLKWIMNLWPPYLGAGIRVREIGQDWRSAEVRLTLRWYNRNAVGTHFGGSLYAMIDPHLMLLLMQLLGKGYQVWDKAATIEFIKPARKKVSAVIRITDEDIDVIRHKTADGDKYFAHFTLDIKDEEGALVARAQKTIYVKRKSDA